jgi:HNH endonuclease
MMIWAPEHPRTGNGSYVFEHVLVMEEMLDRYLLPGETVHHRNGVRDDNRPENLELWTRPQPTGIRASDAIAWAREIIARYGDKSPYTEEGSHEAA